jgi:shikimate dehydrogenase
MKPELKFAVIGNPISQSLSPELHNFVFKQLKLSYIYEKIQTEPRSLPGFINKTRESEFVGFNVTSPHKENIVNLLDIVDPVAKAIGAVNCVKVEKRVLTGYNSDWTGFINSVKLNKINLSDKPILILGSGGAAKAILYALSTMNLKRNITIVYRSLKRAQNLVYSSDSWNFRSTILLESFETIENSLLSDSVIINCTPVGMFPDDSSPIEKKLINSSHTIFDTIYNPTETTLISYAKSVDAKHINGLEMFIYQGLTSQNIWLERDIISQIDFPELFKYLEQKICCIK